MKRYIIKKRIIGVECLHVHLFFFLSLRERLAFHFGIINWLIYSINYKNIFMFFD
jgi:hypothetical protein